MRKLKPSGDNREERINFVKYWADYIKKTPDRIWSKQQNMLINSQMQSAGKAKLKAGEYLKLKGELR